MILQQFDFVFIAAKVKNSLVFPEILSDLPIIDLNEIAHDPLSNEDVYIIDSTGPCYGGILVYLQAQHFLLELSLDDCRHICHQARHYLVLNDTLYHHGVDIVLLRCLTHEEAERILNDYHAGACGGHPFGISTAQFFFAQATSGVCFCILWEAFYE